MKTFQPKLFSTLNNYSATKLTNDIVSGIIVAIIALPLSIALAIASGVSPEQGLYTAIVAGFVISFFGGSSVNISGPTAAFATIVAGIVATHGLSGLILATIFAGIILVLMGIFRFGSLIKYIPMTITTGFTSGIAVTIIIGQLKDFFGLTFAEGTHAVETMEKAEAVVKSFGTLNIQGLIIGCAGLAILILWPMLSKAKLGVFSKICAKIPASIIAVIFGILVVSMAKLDVNTIGTLYPNLPSGMPTPSFPKFDFDTVKAVLPSSFTIALLAAIESLLSCVVSDGMVGDKHNSNTELIAQGVGNICSGLFGGIPATGAIARTAANVKNGGRSPIAGIVHALVLLAFLLVLMPFAKMIPMPIIAAILLMVAYNMSEWRHFVHICRFSELSDVLVLVTTFVLTVVFDLVVAIAVGLVLACVLFMKKMSDVTSVRRWKSEADETRRISKAVPEHTVVYEINGPMFFADSDKFYDFSFEKDTKVVIIRLGNVPSIDATAMGSMEKLLFTCKIEGISLVLSHVNTGILYAMKKSGFYNEIGEENIVDNIDEALSLAEKICKGI